MGDKSTNIETFTKVVLLTLVVLADKLYPPTPLQFFAKSKSTGIDTDSCWTFMDGSY